MIVGAGCGFYAAMPKQWKLIALYMVIVYLVFLAIIHHDKAEVEKEAAASAAHARN